jgi:hypothetical protein
MEGSPLLPDAQMEAMVKRMNYGLIKVRDTHSQGPPGAPCAASVFALSRHAALRVGSCIVAAY